MDPLTGLTNREREVVELLLKGKSNKQIAHSLHITEHTVEFHLKNIYPKVQVNSRTELIIKLGKSVVAGNGETVENRERLQFSNWSASFREKFSRIRKEIGMDNVINSTAHDESDPKTFFGSILVCLKKYAEFNGRASRSEFWWFMLFIVLVTSALGAIDQVIASIFLIAVLLPLLAVGARRLHDVGMSAWWQLYLLVPVGGIILLGFLWARPTISNESGDTLPA